MQNLDYLSLSVMNCGRLLKKRENTKRKGQVEPENGDAYSYTDVKRRSYLFTALNCLSSTRILLMSLGVVFLLLNLKA